MFIINKSELISKPEILKDYVYIPKIDFSRREVLNILVNACGNEVQIIEALNSINNQGITSIDLVAKTYRIGISLLALDCLSTAERLFLIAECAKQANIRVIFSAEVYELCKDVLILFITRYKAEDSVNIVYFSEIEGRVFKSIRGE